MFVTFTLDASSSLSSASGTAFQFTPQLEPSDTPATMAVDPPSGSASSSTFVGLPMPRLEDARLMTGRGCYSDDFSLPGQAYAVVVRSPYAHARIAAVDVSGALTM